jgi:Putative Ig domain
VTNPATTAGTVDAAFSQTFTQTGATGTATFTLNSGSLPAGLGPLGTNGVLSGTPTVPGSFPITVKVTDSNGCTGVGSTYNLVINCQTITVTNPSTTAAVYNTAFSQNFTQSGAHGTATFSLNSGTLPTGLSLTTAGTLSGTPTVTGTFPITVKVTDANGCTGTSATYNLAVKPQANSDTYSTLVNNVQLVVTGGTTTTPSTPAIQSTVKLTANDLPSGGITLATGTFATTQSGSVTVASDGTFLYTPPAQPGLSPITMDTFTYTISSDTGGTGTPATAQGTVTLNLSGRVWFVMNNGAAGNGQSQSPFNTLSSGIGASTANDFIFIYQGDGTSANLSTASTLKPGQQFVGEGAGLTVGSHLLVAAGGFALIGNTVTLANNTSVGGFDMSTGASAGIVGSSVTGISVSPRDVASTTGTAVNISGSGNTGQMTFRSVSANGAGNGITISNFGTPGSLTITGDGASDPTNTTRGNTTAKLGGGTITPGSGGTIQGTTGPGIFLNNTGPVTLHSAQVIAPNAGSQTVNNGNNGITATSVNGLTLDNVYINGFIGNSGLRGTAVTNLVLQHTDIDGNGTAAGTETNNNWNVRLDDLAGDCGNVTAGCGWGNSLFFNSRENIVGILQGVTNTTVSSRLTITNSEFRDTTLTASPSNDALLITAFKSAVTNVTVTGSTLKNVESGGFEYAGNDDSSGSVDVWNNVIENTGSDVLISHNGGTPTTGEMLNFSVTGNTERQLTGNPASTNAITVFLSGGSNSGSQMVGKIENNTIGNLAVSGSGSHVGQGISVNATGAGTITATVTGNTVHQIHQNSVFFGDANSGSATLNLYVHGNTFNSDQSGTGLDALDITGGAVGTDTSKVCLDMASNSLLGDLTYTSVSLQTFGTSASGINLAGLNITFNNNTTAIANFAGANPVTTPPGVNTSALPTPSSSFIILGPGQITGVTNCGVTFPP